MRDFTQEEINVLSEMEGKFKTALELNYSRNIPRSQFELIRSTYEAALGTPYDAGGSCSYCLFKMLKTVGKKYFEDKEKLLKKAAKVVKALDEVFNDVPDEKPVVKKTAPKKTTTKKTNNSKTRKTSKK